MTGLFGSIAAGIVPVNVLAAQDRAKIKTRLSRYSNAHQKVTPFEYVSGYNNFYEFGTDKKDPAKHADKLTIKPWTIKIDGLVNKPGDYHLEDIIPTVQEDRIYRFRCVEGWSMVVPWVGFQLSDLLLKVEPQGSAKFVAFETLVRPEEMLDGCLYPVVTWGHGAMGSPSDYTSLLHILASHGFVVIGSTAGNVQDGGNSGNQFRNKMVEVAEWVVEQNSNSSSVLYQRIDTDKIGASGHSQGGYGASEAGQNPLITTSASSCGAVGSANQKGPALRTIRKNRSLKVFDARERP